MLIGITRTFSWRNPAQIPYIQDYIIQIAPLLQTLYSQSAQQILMQGGIPPPASNTTYLPPAHESLQKLFSELSNVQTSSLGMMAHLQFWKKWEMEQSAPPSTSSQTNKITEVETYNIYSVNKVLVQQILENIGQITKKTLDRDPQQIMKLKPMILELYRQLTCFLFNLEAAENTKTGQISKYPEVWQLVTKIWDNIWKILEQKNN